MVFISVMTYAVGDNVCVQGRRNDLIPGAVDEGVVEPIIEQEGCYSFFFDTGGACADPGPGGAERCRNRIPSQGMRHLCSGLQVCHVHVWAGLGRGGVVHLIVLATLCTRLSLHFLRLFLLFD